jgi:DNA polymerase-3 subunit delta'
MLADIEGQDQALPYLRRIVDGSLVNPLLLVGDEGIGRRYAVTQLAREMFCRGDKTKTCTCIDCTQIEQGKHPDYLYVSSVDDKDIGIDTIRALLESTLSCPSMGQVRILLIDGADRLTIPAANAILKTLEEPPATIRFFLTTESYEKVIPTIRSRCGRVPFRNLSETFIFSVLSRFESDAGKALVYARIAEGSVGRAIRFWTSNRLRLRDQVLTVVEQGLKGDVSSMFSSVDEIGTELPLALRFFEQAVHDLLITPVDPALMVNQDAAEQLQTIRGGVSDAVWIRFRSELKLVHQRYQTSYINLPFHLKTALVNTFIA